MRRVSPAALVFLILGLAGCSGSGGEIVVALHATTMDGVDPTSVGRVTISARGAVIVFHVLIEANSSLSPGQHGFHVHEHGDCDPSVGTTTVPGGAAGGHFNPLNTPHGEHAGDLGNLLADAEGRVDASVRSERVSLNRDDASSIRGRALIIHAQRDDGSQPAGNAGGRALCGIIAG